MSSTETKPVELFETLPLVPLRDMVVFPHMLVPLVVGRQSSILALEQALVPRGTRAIRVTVLEEHRLPEVVCHGEVVAVAIDSYSLAVHVGSLEATLFGLSVDLAGCVVVD